MHALTFELQARSTGRGGMGNIRSGSQARSIAHVPENYPQTASLVSEHSANIAQYEQSIVQQSQETANARAVRFFPLFKFPKISSPPLLPPDSRSFFSPCSTPPDAAD